MPRISITVKNAIVYFLLLILTSVILGYSIYKVSSHKILDNATLSLNHNNELVLLQFKTFLDDIRKDIEFLSKDPFLYQLLDEPQNEKTRYNLSHEYLALLGTKTHYLQIRLLGVKQNGKELIRAEKFSDRIGLVEHELLQEKGDRDYFRETIQLPIDSIYFSEINLNQEFGKIILPMVPTMRVAKSIYHRDSLFGIIIINVDLSFVFNELIKTAGKPYTLNLINSKGYYLIHPDSSKVFGFEFNKKPELDFDNGNISIYQTLSAKTNEIFSVREFHYPRKQEVLYFSLSASKEILLSVFNQWKRDIFLLTVILTLLSLLIAVWWTQRQTKEFRNLAQSITSFGKNPEHVKLEIDRDDEIGDLVHSFKEMSGKINEHLAELRIARSEAVEANKAKSEFLENMSHEIRNPLQSILGMIGILEQNKPRPDQQVFIDTLKFSSDTLLTLVNDILDYRKLIHGQIQLNYQSIILEDFIEKIIKSHLFDAGIQKIKLNLNIDPLLKYKLFQTDPIRLAQILHNLLSNAIRHAYSNSEVTLELCKKSSDEIEFSIRNFGESISQENITNILEQKPVTGSSKLTQNIGLGLPIVINLLKLFNSGLQIESKPETGTRFNFNLKGSISLATAPKTILTNAPIDFSGFVESMACIDDDPQNLFYYKQVFEKFNLNATHFSSIQDFIKSKPGNLDLILTDYNFQDGQISQHLDELKNALRPKGLLFLISASDELNKQVPLDQFDGILQKPIQGDVLLKKIEEQITKNYFEKPQFDQLYANYDFQRDKISKALEITLAEWKEMGLKMNAAIVNRDLLQFDKVYHRLINTLRTFNLHSFQQLLDTGRIQISASDSNEKQLVSKVNFCFRIYQRMFEEELQHQKAN